MKISLVIPAHNEAKYIVRCLGSVIAARLENLHEIIVVDNASSDNTAAVALSFPGVRVVREEKKGLTRARQTGFENATGDIIAYVDADTEMPPEWFQTVVQEFSKNGKLVCLSGPYRYYDISRVRKIAVPLFWLLMAFPSYLFIGYMVVGGNFAARRKSLQAIGGFDTSISFYGEDTDIARRLHAVGKVKFKPSFFIRTSGRRFSGQGFLKTGIIYVGNFISEVIFHHPITRKYKDIR